jgi:TolA-binding protein
LDDYCNQVEKQLEATIAQQEKNQQDKEQIEKGAKELDAYCNQIEGQLQDQISTLQKLQSEKESFKKKVIIYFMRLKLRVLIIFLFLHFPQNIQLQENVEDLQRQLQEEKYRSQHFQFRISELQQELSQRLTIQSILEQEKQLTEQRLAEKELKKPLMEDTSRETKGDETTGHVLMTKTVLYNEILTEEVPSPIPGVRIGGGSNNASTQASPSSVKPFDLERFDPDYRLPAR